MRRDLAVPVEVAGQLVGLIKDQALQEADHLSTLVVIQAAIGIAGDQSLAAMPADDGIEVEAGAVVAVRGRRAGSP